MFFDKTLTNAFHRHRKPFSNTYLLEDKPNGFQKIGQTVMFNLSDTHASFLRFVKEIGRLKPKRQNDKTLAPK